MSFHPLSYMESYTQSMYEHVHNFLNFYIHESAIILNRWAILTI